MDIHEQIQVARQAKGWSREKLANALGVTKQAVTNWETGAGVPRIGRWKQIEKLLGCTLTHAGTQDELPAERQLSADSVRMALEIGRLKKAHRDAISVVIDGLRGTAAAAPAVMVGKGRSAAPAVSPAPDHSKKAAVPIKARSNGH